MRRWLVVRWLVGALFLLSLYTLDNSTPPKLSRVETGGPLARAGWAGMERVGADDPIPVPLKDNPCPRVGAPASPEGEGAIISSRPILIDGKVYCQVSAEGRGQSGSPPPSQAAGGQAAKAGGYPDQWCNVEIALHDQLRTEMVSQHLHQRYTYGPGADTILHRDDTGEGRGGKTIQWRGGAGGEGGA